MQLITSVAGSAQPTNIIKIVNFDILVEDVCAILRGGAYGAGPGAPHYNYTNATVHTQFWSISFLICI